MNRIAFDRLHKEIKCKAKIRSTQIPVDVWVTPSESGIKVRFDDMQKSIAAGQSIVLYDDDIVLGGSVIC